MTTTDPTVPQRPNGLGLPNRLERRLALRYLKSRRASRLASLTTVIATGGVAVGVMALIVVLGVMNGLVNEVRERILVGTPHLRILTYGAGIRVDDWRSALSVVRDDADVVAAAPQVLTESVISAGADYAEGVMVQGIEPDTGGVTPVTSLPDAVTDGDLTLRTSLDDVDGAILLGARLAGRLGAYPGDVVTLVSPNPQVSPVTGYPTARYWRFEVTGLFDTGMFQYDNKLVVIARPIAQEFAGLDEAVSAIEVRVNDPWKAQAIGDGLAERLGYPYRALDWQSQNAALFSALKLEKLAMGLIIFFIMIVAGFNIVGTLTMIVSEKTREIGILQAMGLPARGIGRVFRPGGGRRASGGRRGRPVALDQDRPVDISNRSPADPN
jgi:lipoprotein-releasing system permease protein